MRHHNDRNKPARKHITPSSLPPKFTLPEGVSEELGEFFSELEEVKPIAEKIFNSNTDIVLETTEEFEDYLSDDILELEAQRDRDPENDIEEEEEFPKKKTRKKK